MFKDGLYWVLGVLITLAIMGFMMACGGGPGGGWCL